MTSSNASDDIFVPPDLFNLFNTPVEEQPDSPLDHAPPGDTPPRDLRCITTDGGDAEIRVSGPQEYNAQPEVKEPDSSRVCTASGSDNAPFPLPPRTSSLQCQPEAPALREGLWRALADMPYNVAYKAVQGVCVLAACILMGRFVDALLAGFANEQCVAVCERRRSPETESML